MEIGAFAVGSRRVPWGPPDVHVCLLDPGMTPTPIIMWSASRWAATAIRNATSSYSGKAPAPRDGGLEGSRLSYGEELEATQHGLSASSGLVCAVHLSQAAGGAPGPRLTA